MMVEGGQLFRSLSSVKQIVVPGVLSSTPKRRAVKIR